LTWRNGAGAEFQVNQTTPLYQWVPSLAMDDAGGFIVVWESYGSSGGDTDGQSVQLRRYSPAGQPLGGEFQVNRYTTSGQRYPIVASRGREFVALDERRFGPDTDGQSLQARRFTLPQFADGFESATTAAWSSVVP
jgi:hypothetical protein